MSCTNNLDDEEETTIRRGMYQDYKLDEDILFSAKLPVLSIQTDKNKQIADKENWISAKMEVKNAPVKNWNFEDLSVSVRGRGNSTWNKPKRPFAIKLDKKKQILGMPEGKRWVLIANYKDNSFLKNHISFFLCKKLGMDYTVRGEFVNLVLNGNYVGLYWFGEAVKVDINRVDIDTDKDFLLEIDSYFDEEWKFKSDIKAIPYNIRNDDTMSKERLEKLKTTINDFESKFYNDDGSVKSESEYKLSDYLDFDSMAKFYIVNELMRNIELHYMKSCFMTLDSTNILKAGPVWDMDSSCYVQDTVYKCKDSLYYDLLFTNSIFRKTVSDLLDGLFIEEILSEIRAFESKVYDSVKLDNARWGIHTDQDGKYRGDFFQSVDFVEKVITIWLNWLKAEF